MFLQILVKEWHNYITVTTEFVSTTTLIINSSTRFRYTVKLGYIKLGFYEYMVYIEVLQRPERNPIDFHVK